MKRKSLLFLLLIGLFVPLAANAQTSFFSEDFEGGSMPSGWTTDGPGTWSVGSGDYSTSTGAGQGTYNAKITHGTTGNVTKLITPAINLASAGSAELSFMHVQRSWAGDIDQLRVYYRTSSSGSWNLLEAYTSAVSSWTTHSITLSDFSGTYQIAFEYTDKYGYGVGIDNISIVGETVSCTLPTNVHIVGEIGPRTVTIAWNAESGDMFQYAMLNGVVTDFSSVTWGSAEQISTQNWNTLNPDSDYTFAIRKYCSAADQSPVVSLPIHTDIACPAPTGLAIVPNSETAHGATLSWTGSSSSNSYVVMVGVPDTEGTVFNADFETGDLSQGNFTSTADYPFTVVANDHSGAYCAKSNNGGQHSKTADMVLEVNLASAGTLSFSAKVSSESSWDKAYFSIDGTTQSDLNGISGNGSWSDYEYTLAAGTHTLRWYYTKDSSGNSNDDCFYVDDIEITGLVPSTWSEYTANTNSITISDLNPATPYFAKVKGDCGSDGYSQESNIVSFTTLETCPTPQNLAVTTDGATATATWTGTEGTCNISINGTVTNNVTSPYIFNVDLSTTYEVMVQANCTDETGNWSDVYSFTTPPCVNGHVIEYSLADSYGDGWNGNAIIIADACGTIETLTIDDGTTNNGTLTLCGGTYYTFTWQSGSYAGETSFTLIYNGTTIYSGQSGSSFSGGQVLYTIGTAPTMLPRPTGLTAGTPGTREVQLSWTENGSATAWEICVNGDETNLIAANANTDFTLDNTNAGLVPDTDYTVKVRATNGTNESCWSNEVSFTTAANCAKPTDLAVGTIGARNVLLSWTDNAEASAWQICVNDDETNLITANTNTDFNLTDLEPETNYTVKVRANCGGGDGDSQWSNTLSFTTTVACPAPTTLTATDITSNSAVISWPGEGAYELRVGTIESSSDRNTLFYDFEDGFGDWTTIDADGDGFTWTLLSNIESVTTYYTSHDWGIDGSDAVFSGSYINGASVTTTPDNLLVSPLVALGGSITFYAKGLDSNYPEHFGVCVSTTNNTDANAFTVLQEWDTDEDTEYHEYTVDLSAYSGLGYIAIRDFNVEDMYVVIIDNVTIEEGILGEITWGDPITGVTSPYDLTGLDPETQYFVEVRANCGDEGYSAWTQVGFRTKGLCDVPNNLTATEVTARTATLNWNGVQESYNVQYRTASYKEELFYSDFDSGIPEDWTNTGGLFSWTGTTDYFVMLGYTEAGTQYLISSDLTAYEGAATIEFVQRYYGDVMTFKVGFSSTTTDVDAFTWGDDVTASASETLYSVAIPTGAKYFAIQVTTEEAETMGVIIDDLGIYGEVIPAGGWETATVTETTLDLTGLTPETDYEWQVRGVNRNCDDGVTEWSAIATFTTEPSCPVPTDLAYSNGELTWTSDAASFDIQFYGEEVIEGVTSPYTPNLDFETIYAVRVRANCGEGDYSDWTDYLYFVTECSGAKDLPYTYGFEDEGELYACWTMYTAEGNENSFGIGSDESIEAVDGSNFFVFSSYNNYETDYDQYLYSPELNATGEVAVEFYYRTGSGSGSGELFKVGYSTDGTSFTWGDEISTTTTEWTQYADTLPEGTKYVAIHYYSNYQYYLLVDGFSFTSAATTVTQTIALGAGSNWISTYVDITLDELKAALVEALPGTTIKISSRTQTTTYNGSRWRGQLNTMDVNQMYKVEVTADSEITLEGMPFDPVANPMSIEPGVNWIAYPLTTSTTVANAFAGFAVSGDKLNSRTQNTSYNGSRWRGQLSAIVPGEGYIYNSASTETRTFVFPTSAKKSMSSKKSVKTSFVKILNSINKGSQISHPTNKCKQ